MKSLLPAKNEPFRLELLRDQFRVVDRRGGDLAALRKSQAKMRRILKAIPPGLVDVVAEVRKVRDSGGWRA